MWYVWGVWAYPRLSSSPCTPWRVCGLCVRLKFTCQMRICSECAKMQENRAKSVIFFFHHKHRINNVPGRKSFLFPAHCGSFFHELIENPRTQWDTGESPMWHKHIWRSVSKKRGESKIAAQERKICATFVRVTVHLSLLSDWFAGWEGEWVGLFCDSRVYTGFWSN